MCSKKLIIAFIEIAIIFNSLNFGVLSLKLHNGHSHTFCGVHDDEHKRQKRFSIASEKWEKHELTWK
jgi:hypothetical protein